MASSRYLKLVRPSLTGQQTAGVYVDIYDVLMTWKVTCPATQHAIKKLLAAGERGHKDRLTDLVEAGDAVRRAVELEKARGES